MKIFTRITWGALLALFIATASASAETKLGTVDLKKIFDNYWKTRQADTTLKDRAGEFDKRRKEMMDDGRKVQDDYNKLLETANDQAVSGEEREKRKQSAEKKLLELKEIETSLAQFDRTARTQLGEQQRNMRDKILVEIKDVVASKAKAAGYEMVFDTAGETVNGTPAVFFSAGKTDLTDEVLTQLNATAPPGILKNDPPKPEAPKDDGKKKEGSK
jgi:outer membrane protein